MNEINESKSQGGEKTFAPKSYDIAFENVDFAYNSGEAVLKDVPSPPNRGK